MIDITSKYKHMNQHIMLKFYVVHLQDGSYVHRTVFLYYNLREVHSLVAPHMQLEIFWVTMHSSWSPSLLDLFSISILPSYNILSLSLCQSLRIVTYMLNELATGYSKITTVDNKTRA